MLLIPSAKNTAPRRAGSHVCAASHGSGLQRLSQAVGATGGGTRHPGGLQRLGGGWWKGDVAKGGSPKRGCPQKKGGWGVLMGFRGVSASPSPKKIKGGLSGLVVVWGGWEGNGGVKVVGGCHQLWGSARSCPKYLGSPLLGQGAHPAGRGDTVVSPPCPPSSSWGQVQGNPKKCRGGAQTHPLPPWGS